MNISELDILSTASGSLRTKFTGASKKSRLRPVRTLVAGQSIFFAFDAADLSKVLFQTVAGQWLGNGDTGGASITSLVVNGRVRLATDGTVTAFGIH